MLLDHSRTLADRVNDPSPHDRHAFLALLLDALHVEVSTQVHPRAWVDFDTVKARSEKTPTASLLMDKIRNRPEPFAVGVVGQPTSPCEKISGADLLSLLEQAQQTAQALWIGWAIPRDVALENAAMLDEQLQDALVALAPVYAQMSWNEQDDPGDMLSRIEKMRAEYEAAGTQRAQQSEREREHKALER